VVNIGSFKTSSVLAAVISTHYHVGWSLLLTTTQSNNLLIDSVDACFVQFICRVPYTICWVCGLDPLTMTVLNEWHSLVTQAAPLYVLRVICTTGPSFDGLMPFWPPVTKNQTQT